ncbi:tRNA lysidine(34) synthetase TilS [Parabacteroides sp. FAFU027]|uniref:tRNA lysidine(34) synthetase TilS n=1 Tax=Parabacteroides sp. FAFU027 TaxID=2922715 RepID=UPI001FAEE0DA|nr:tRNA lysidine(34) synthetase TilS [Parabacteroides sp. FAFU027]
MAECRYLCSLNNIRVQLKVKAYIQQNKLLPDGVKVITGVSGGADSVALLHYLKEAGYECIAAHCNFHLRGEESNRDEEFVRDLCGRWDVPLEVIDFHTEKIAAEQKVSIEMAARELRYQWFEELRIQYKAEVIAVAHHKDDSVETFLLNLIRGTGIRGLSGMKPVNGKIIRPLLCVSRQEVEEYIEQNNLSFVHDSTNSETLYTRNKIRLEVLPLLQQFNPSIKETIIQTSCYLSDTAEVYFSEIEKQRRNLIHSVSGKTYISIPELKKSPFAQTILFELLSPFGFNSTVCAEIFESLDGLSGKQFFSTEYRLVKNREELIIDKKKEENEVSITIPSPEEKVRRPFYLSFDIIPAANFSIPKDKEIGCFDADKVRFPLTLRKWKIGDRFVPFGMKGSKKLSDYFSDRKFSLLQKEEANVLCSGNKIIWLIGERTDNRFRIDEQTTKILVIQYNANSTDL